MANTNYQTIKGSNYDARWFIWTIVFLVATGVALTVEIVFSDNGNNDVPILVQARTVSHQTTNK